MRPVRLPGTEKRRHKYNAERNVVVDGEKFDSRKEANFWCQLKQMERAGVVRNIRRQVWFVLLAPVLHGALDNVNDGRQTGRRAVGNYVADFDYEECDRRTGKWTRRVADVKGCRTAFYKWKKRHFEFQYGVPIQEV